MFTMPPYSSDMVRARYVHGWRYRRRGYLAGNAGEAALLKAMQSGMAKVMSKMGISVLDSYRAAQLFDILGLDSPVDRLLLRGQHVAIRRLGFCRDRGGGASILGGRT